MTQKSLAYMSSGIVATLALSTSIATAQVTPTPIVSGDNGLFSSRVLTTSLDMVLSRLRSGLLTHLCGLSLKCQGAFAA
jgi:hypothetical protein